MASFLDAFRAGQSVAQTGISAYEKADTWKRKLAEKEEAETKSEAERTRSEKPLSQEELTEIETGKIPATLRRSEQLQLQKEKASGTKNYTTLSKEQAKSLQDAGLPAEAGESVPNTWLAKLVKNPTQASASLAPDKMERARTWMAANTNKITMKQAADPKFVSALSDMLERGVNPNPIEMEGQEAKQKSAAVKEGQSMTTEAKKTIAQDWAEGKLDVSNLPSLLGRGSPKDRSDIYEMVHKINPDFSVAKAHTDYQAGLKKASAIAGVQGAEGQKIGAVAASMDDMIAKAEPLIPKVSPTQFKTINAALQVGKNEINDPELVKVYTYLTSAAGFYASLQKNGGVPSDIERQEAMKVISSKLNQGGFAAVKQALSDEAKSRVKRIKENQSQTGPGSDAPTPSNYAPKKVNGIWTHEENGKVMEWHNGKWVVKPQ
jgi:hypothetical protein